MLCQRHGFARELLRACVERLRDERPFVQVEQIAGRGIEGARIGLRQATNFARVERPDADSRLLAPRRAEKEEEVMTVGQKVGPEVVHLVARFVKLHHLRRFAARRGYAVDAALALRLSEKDHAVFAPRPGVGIRCGVAQGRRRAARRSDLLELALGHHHGIPLEAGTKPCLGLIVWQMSTTGALTAVRMVSSEDAPSVQPSVVRPGVEARRYRDHARDRPVRIPHAPLLQSRTLSAINLVSLQRLRDAVRK